MWRKFLRKVFKGPQTSLDQPLGPWKPMIDASWTGNWDYFMTLEKEFLYHRVKSRWQRHLKRQYSHKSYHVEYLDLDDIPTQNIYRVSIKTSATCLLVTSLTQKPDIPTPPDTIAHTFGKINLLKPKIDWFMNYISSSPNTDNLWRELLMGKAYAVSDSSYFPISQTGACAWIVSTRDGTEWIKGGGIIPGCKEDQDPYRSELGGQVGLASVITAIILPSGTTPNITIACDGEAAINRVNMDSKIIKSNMTNVDMLSIISELWGDSSFTITKKHVY